MPAKGTHEGAARWFFAVPIVGLLEGLIVAAVGYLLYAWPLISSTCMVAAHILITGGMHLDGTADYGDVIGSHKRGREALEVLKDPRRGAYGIIALTFILIARFSSLYYLASHPLAVVASYVVGLEGAYLTSALGVPEPYEGMARLIVLEARRPSKVGLNVVIASIIIGVISSLQPKTLVELVGLIPAAGVAMDSNRRLGFVNGDALGFAIELGEVLALTVAAV